MADARLLGCALGELTAGTALDTVIYASSATIAPVDQVGPTEPADCPAWGDKGDVSRGWCGLCALNAGGRSQRRSHKYGVDVLALIRARQT